MKKAIAFLLVLLFLINNSGMAVNVHWCGGKLASVDFFSSGKHSCRCGKKVMKPKCCKDKSIELKEKTDSAKISQFTFKLELPKNVCALIKRVEATPTINRSFFYTHSYRPPPNKPKVPIFLLDKVILI